MFQGHMCFLAYGIVSFASECQAAQNAEERGILKDILRDGNANGLQDLCGHAELHRCRCFAKLKRAAVVNIVGYVMREFLGRFP